MGYTDYVEYAELYSFVGYTDCVVYARLCSFVFFFTDFAVYSRLFNFVVFTDFALYCTSVWVIQIVLCMPWVVQFCRLYRICVKGKCI